MNEKPYGKLMRKKNYYYSMSIKYEENKLKKNNKQMK